MTLEQVEERLRRIRDDHYGADSSIRHDPFYRDIGRLLAEVSAAVDQAQDELAAQELETWEMKRQHSPSV